MLTGIIALVIAYLLGSFPAAYLMARWRKGIDIREVGVRNMGGANVMREVGRWEGIVVLFLDAGKGAAAVFIAQQMGVAYPWVLGAGLAAFLGHNYPLYIGFRGGKGIATLIGIFLVLAPVVMGITLGIIGFFLLFTRHIFSSVAIASPFFLLVIWLVEGSPVLIFYALAIVVFSLVSSRRRLVEIGAMTARGRGDIKAFLARFTGSDAPGD